jgi:hypothetical protein
MHARTLAEPSIRRGLALLGLGLSLTVLVWALLTMPSNAQAATVRLDGVRTTLTTDPATTTLLFTAGIIPLPVWPTPIVPTADAARYTFPVTGGAVDATTLAGRIRHSGGLLLAQRTNTNGWKSLSLTGFTIVISKEPHISAVVNGGKRLPIASLDLSKDNIKRFARHGRSYVRVGNVSVNLNATAIGAVNATFDTTLTAPVHLGTANVLVRVAR